MTINEAIEEILQNSRKCLEYHEQIVQHLEELKEVKMHGDFKSGVDYAIEEIANNMEKMVYNSLKKEQNQFNRGYLQAIKDMTKQCVKVVIDNAEEVKYD